MSTESVVTREGEDRGYRLCKCNDCGDISRCTPENDFYSKELGGALQCERCMLSSRGNPLFVDLTRTESEEEGS